MMSWLDVSMGVTAKAGVIEMKLKITAKGRSMRTFLLDNLNLSRGNCIARAGSAKINFCPTSAKRRDADVKETALEHQQERHRKKLAMYDREHHEVREIDCESQFRQRKC